MDVQRYLTSQQAVGRVGIYCFDDHNLMVWNGTDDDHSLNIATASPGSFTFPSASTGQAGSPDAALCGPAFCSIGADLAYLAWVNANNKITLGQLQRSVQGTEVIWALSGTPTVITASNPASPPVLGVEGSAQGVLINLIWQDKAAGGLVQAQIEYLNPSPNLQFQALAGASCAAGAPELARIGTRSCLAWSSAANADGSGTLTFSISPTSHVVGLGPRTEQLSISGANCADGVAVVGINPSYAIALRGGPGGVFYDGFGPNARHVWTRNNAKGASGSVTTTVPLATVFAGKCLFTDQKGMKVPRIVTAWPEQQPGSQPNEIVVSLFAPPAMPIPVG